MATTYGNISFDVDASFGNTVPNYVAWTFPFVGNNKLRDGHILVTGITGFSPAIDHLELRPYFRNASWTGGAHDIFYNPDLIVNVHIGDWVFLPELFSQESSSLGGELGIYLAAIIADGSEVLPNNTLIAADGYPLSDNYIAGPQINHYVNAAQRENTQNITTGKSGVNHARFTSPARFKNVFSPIGFKVVKKISSNHAFVDHYEIDFQGTTLTNYMFPSSVFMPDSTWRLMAYNRAEKRYDIFSTTIGSREGGFMVTVWGSDYHAAHMTRLIDGTLCTMAWAYSSDDTNYRLYFKRSADDGATWGDPILVCTLSSTAPFAKTFNPTWVIVQDYRTGTVVIGDYFSDDMGNSWNVTT